MRSSNDIIQYVECNYPELSEKARYKLCMRIYAEESLDAAARAIHPYENGEKRKVMCNSILALKRQLK